MTSWRRSSEKAFGQLVAGLVILGAAWWVGSHLVGWLS